MEPLKDAVTVHNVWKSYGSWKGTFHVLNGINLSVPRGTVYGLLGPSGCGKTTLLRSIVGTININKGTILVLGQPPGGAKTESGNSAVGFMPQDISLNENLTIKESFQFYGAINGMTTSMIQKKRKFFMELLGISNANKTIDTLSGGQKRRASLAIALLHEPKLLILDEPTVGVDPVLRKKIWEYLTTCILENTSIVITTHYIEEARMASKVGLMQKGEILAEGSPDDLMNYHNCATLEKVFLKLCVEADSTTSHNVPQNATEPYTPSKKLLRKDREEKDECDTRNSSFKKCVTNKCRLDLPQWYRIKALMIKNFYFYMRHKGLLGFVILMPPLLMILSSFSVGTPITGVPIGVVNDDLQELSSIFLKKINSDVILQMPYSNLYEAKTAIKMGSILGFIHFNHNFSDTMKLRFQEGSLVDDYAINNSNIEISLDVMSPPLVYTITSQLMLAFQEFSQATALTLDLNPNIGAFPVKYHKMQVYGRVEMSFNEFIFPGLLICLSFFMAMSTSAVVLISEKQDGSFERMTICGIVTTEMLISHILASTLFLASQILMLFIATFLIIGHTCQGSYVLLLLLLLLQAICGLTLGLAISSVTSDEALAMILCLAVWVFMFFTQNFLWPTEGLPEVGRVLSRMMPQTYAIEASRSIIHRGWGLLYSDISYGFGITLIWCCIFSLIVCATAGRRG